MNTPDNLSVPPPWRVRIPELYARPGPTVSFEFFPPKTDAAEATLFRETVPALQELRPGFISVTFGAGGSTRDRTFRIAQRLRQEHHIQALAHVTCVGGSRDDLAAILDQAAELGFENLLALRGDPPHGQTSFQPVEGGFRYAIDLIRFVKSRHRFTIGAACYPEGHIECGDKKLDWDRTAAKVEAGADFLISQLFYDVRHFLELEDYLRNKHGVQVPIVPGVLPFLSGEQIKRFAALGGARLPTELVRRIDALGDDHEAVRRLGVEVCADLCRQLFAHGVPGVHVYCLNRAASARELVRAIAEPRN
jgi:methylenetetrahydrofolate reductase (NADPH)